MGCGRDGCWESSTPWERAALTCRTASAHTPAHASATQPLEGQSHTLAGGATRENRARVLAMCTRGMEVTPASIRTANTPAMEGAPRWGRASPRRPWPLFVTLVSRRWEPRRRSWRVRGHSATSRTRRSTARRRGADDVRARPPRVVANAPPASLPPPPSRVP